MKDRTKRTWGNIFGSILSNERAIEGAKFSPWWIAIILFLIGCFLPVIPNMTQVGKTYGSSFMDGATTSNFNTKFATASYEAYENGYELEIQNSEMSCYKDNTQIIAPLEKIGSAYRYDASINGISETALDIYYSYLSKDAVREKVNALESTKYKSGTENENPTSEEDKTYTPSFILFFRDGIAISIYELTYIDDFGDLAVGTSTPLVSTTADLETLDYKHVDNTNKLFEQLLVFNSDDSLNEGATINNFKALIDNAYKTSKNKIFWSTSGIFFGIYCGATILMGLMIFLLTRGKNNPNRSMNFLVCEGVACWSAFTPGLLAMILSFIGLFSNMSTMLFVLFLGIRTMWLAMKSLAPVYNDR